MDKERVIFSSHHIVEIIFKHLNSRTLSKCAQVCSLWYKLSVAEKKRRRNIYWTLKDGDCNDIEILRQMELCPIIDRSFMEAELLKEMENIPMHPVFCMAFMSVPLFAKFPEFFPSFGCSEPPHKRQRFCEDFAKRKYLNEVMHCALKDFLPANCPLTFTVASGIVGCNANCEPREIENGPAMSAIFIPEVSGVTISHFRVNRRNFDMSEFIAENAPVKCILVFLTSRGARSANKLVQSCLLHNKDLKMAVGGAIVDRTEGLLGSVVAFSGPNVEAASIIINVNDKKEEIIAKFETFQETGLLNHMCFAYMFACVGRGFIFHEDFNVESKLFCKMYPKVPLVGVYGGGEIGYNYLPNFQMEKTLKTGAFARYQRKFLHGYTSVFVLISLKV
ncbi:hypothetical protein NPIL_84901 [Nephila pilipes]|uniref:FIST C-domain domain-containing protein n=1 Tax=Nephila pilipes TaxID=299642 RepID=A0A8X6PAD6_NEPPI|nr:hypothetical protein NPIL_84901 [Nephila pilipes]